MSWSRKVKNKVTESQLPVYTADVVEVHVSGVFKTQHEFWIGGENVGTLFQKAGRLRGDYRDTHGKTYWINQPSILKKQFQFGEGGELLGIAEHGNALKAGIKFKYRDALFWAKPATALGKEYIVKDINGVIVLMVKPRGGLKRGALIRVFREVQIGFMVFFYALVTRRWQEK